MNIIRYYYTKSGEYRTKWEVRGIRLTDAGREADGGRVAFECDRDAARQHCNFLNRHLLRLGYSSRSVPQFKKGKTNGHTDTK